jgi:hypothetical protein
MSKAHPGFKAVQSKIASERGVSKERAGAILGAATRGASASAKRANPRLKRVKGKYHEGGTIPENGAYELEKGEKVIPAHGHAYEHQAVSAMPNSPGATGVGYWCIDGDKLEFHK